MKKGLEAGEEAARANAQKPLYRKLEFCVFPYERIESESGNQSMSGSYF